MNVKVTLPEIDTATKQRVVNYFDKAKTKGQVIVETYRDNLPDTIQMLKVITFVPASGKKSDIFIDNEAIVASVVYNKSGETQLGLSISSLVNKNAQGIPCGSKNENLMFDGSNVEWLFALKTI